MKCAVESCDRDARARGWCKMHWKRWKVHGDPAYTRPAPAPIPPCAVDGCDNPKHGYIYCSKHYQRWKTNGDPLIVGDHYPGRPRLEIPSYAGVHKRLSRERGRATQFACATCGLPAHEWSYNGGAADEVTENYKGTLIAYSVDQSSYSPRCRPCHRRMDDSLNRGRDAAGRWASAKRYSDTPGITIHAIREDKP